VQCRRDFCKRGVEGRKWNEKLSDLHCAFRDASGVLAWRFSGFSRRLRDDPFTSGFRADLSGAALHAAQRDPVTQNFFQGENRWRLTKAKNARIHPARALRSPESTAAHNVKRWKRLRTSIVVAAMRPVVDGRTNREVCSGPGRSNKKEQWNEHIETRQDSGSRHGGVRDGGRLFDRL
jgi:hypothetical protein